MSAPAVNSISRAARPIWRRSTFRAAETLVSPAARCTRRTIQGDLTNQGGTLAPGSSPGSTAITGNYSSRAAAKLGIEIGGASPGTGFDVVSVGGHRHAGRHARGFVDQRLLATSRRDVYCADGGQRGVRRPRRSAAPRPIRFTCWSDLRASRCRRPVCRAISISTVWWMQPITWCGAKGPGYLPSHYDLWRANFGQPERRWCERFG